MNPSCAHTDQLDAYLDGDLAPAAARAFEAHAETCRACADELALARRIEGAFRALPQEPCPYDVYQGALDRIAHEGKDRPPLPTASRVRIRRPRWQLAGLGVALSVAFAVLVALTLFLLRPTSAPPSAEEVAVTATDTPSATVAPLDEAPPDAQATMPDDSLDAPSPAPEAPAAPVRRATPRTAAPRAYVAAATNTPPSAPPSATAEEPTPEEVESAREGVLLAFSLFADANRRATEAVRSNVGQQLEHVTDALAITGFR